MKKRVIEKRTNQTVCLECCGGCHKAVRECPNEHCVLHPLRGGVVNLPKTSRMRRKFTKMRSICREYISLILPVHSDNT